MKLRYSWCLLLLIFFNYRSYGQSKFIDSLKRELARSQADTSRVLLLAELAFSISRYSTDTSEVLARQALWMSRALGYGKGEVRALWSLGNSFRTRGEIPQAMEYALRALNIAQSVADKKGEALALNMMGLVYNDMRDPRQALRYYRQSQKVYESMGDREGVAWEISNMSDIYINLNLLDSAQVLNEQSFEMFKSLPNTDRKAGITTNLMGKFGRIQLARGNTAEALSFYRQALAISRGDNNLFARTTIFSQMSEAFQQTGQADSSLHYALMALGTSLQLKNINIDRVSGRLAELYKARGNLDSAYYYQEMATRAVSARYGPEKVQQLQRLVLEEQQRQQQQGAAQRDYRNRVQLFSLLVGLTVVALIAFLLYRNNRQKQRSNELLLQKNEKIETTLTELRATQTQLIQKEKMASLGELTAGIAHEIQNPLNFVNNYSEMNVELMEEMEEELKKGDLQEAQVLLTDLRDNEAKIHHHGRRADAIVRGMLEHARTTPGERQPTDLNRLAEEYLRLAYQGQKAKDADFQCELVTDYDPNLGEVEVVAPDIGRVLLNLYNNAFYALRQKQLIAADQAYTPTVWVSTKKINGSVEIRVRDNGVGIPEAIREKIFQPFFTTKPTGEGTGLGLSLSYDIVTKGHGGTMRVESQEGVGTEIVITLPTR